MDTGQIPPRLVWLWVGRVAMLTLAAFLLSVVTQQGARRTAEDTPRALLASSQARLASGQTAQAVASGWPVDLASGGTPFVAVYDADHHLLASNASMAGAPLNIPTGVLDDALQRGEDAVTWQPGDNVREATVAQPWTSTTGHGVVAAGVSLAATEARTVALRNWILAVWALCLLGLAPAVARSVRRATRDMGRVR